MDNLEILVKQLWEVGIKEIFCDGSFVEEKDHPGDIDGYFCCEKRSFATGEIQRNLNSLNSHQCWTWQPEQDPASGKLKLPMWIIYHIEFFPDFGQPTGIKDEFGNNQIFPAAFRKSRNSFKPKGILKIVGAPI